MPFGSLGEFFSVYDVFIYLFFKFQVFEVLIPVLVRFLGSWFDVFNSSILEALFPLTSLTSDLYQ